MSLLPTSRIRAFGILVLFFVAHVARTQQQTTWVWKDEEGFTRTRAELDEVLQNAAQVSLYHARLPGADLNSAQLIRANLSGADLSGALMSNTNLRGADLVGAKLAGAILWSADLRGADLTGTDLTDADLLLADLSNTVFEPRALPDLYGIAQAKNLDLMFYRNNPAALVQLRKRLADAGFREQERKVTYALKRQETVQSWSRCKSRQPRGTDKARAILWSSDSNLANCASFVLNRVFFDWTSQFGMSPGRPLSLGGLLWLGCSFLYFICIHASRKSGLYRSYPQGMEGAGSTAIRVEQVSAATLDRLRGWQGLPQYLRQEWRVMRTSMFFSLMSAFNIGFRDINFGRWLRLLTRQEFDIKAFGWARVVAGWQSLISVYLIALWVLTYFGRPFG